MSPPDLLDDSLSPSKKSGSLYDDKFQGEDPDDIDPYEDIQDAAASDEDDSPSVDDWHPLNPKLQKKDKKKGADADGADDDSSDDDDDSDDNGSDDDSDDYAYAAEDKKPASTKDKKVSDKKADTGYEDAPDDGGGADDYADVDSDAAAKKASSDGKRSAAPKGGVSNKASAKKGADSDADDPADDDDYADVDSSSPPSSKKASKADGEAAAEVAAEGGGGDDSSAEDDASPKKNKSAANVKKTSPSSKKATSPAAQDPDDDPYAGDVASAQQSDEGDPYAGGDQDAYEDAPKKSAASRLAAKPQGGKSPARQGKDDPYAGEDPGGDPTADGGGEDPSYGDVPKAQPKKSAAARQAEKQQGGKSPARQGTEDPYAGEDLGGDPTADGGGEDPSYGDGDAPNAKEEVAYAAADGDNQGVGPSKNSSKKKDTKKSLQASDDPLAEEPKDDGSAYDPDMVGEQAPPISKKKQDCCDTGECAPCGTQDSSVEDDLQDQADQLEQPSKMYDKLKKKQEEVDGYNQILANPHRIFRDPDLLHTAKNDPDNLDQHFRKMGRNTNSAPPPDPEDIANDPEYMETIQQDHRAAARHVQELGKQYGLSVIEMPLTEMNSHIENLHNKYDPNKKYEDPTQASNAPYGVDPNGGDNAYGDSEDPYGGYQQKQPAKQRGSVQGRFEQLQQYSDADYGDDGSSNSPPQESDMYGPAPAQAKPVGGVGPSSPNYSYGDNAQSTDPNYSYAGNAGYSPEDYGYGPSPGPYGGYNGTHHNEKLSRALQVLSSDDHDLDPETEGKIRRSISNIQHFQDDPEAFEQDVVSRSDESGTMIAGMRPSEMNQLYYKVKGIARQNQVENNVFIPDPIRPDSGIPYNDKVRAQQGFPSYGYGPEQEENYYGTPYYAPPTNKYGPQYSGAKNSYYQDNRYNVEDPYSAPMQRQMAYQGGIGRMSPDPYGPGPAGMGAQDGDPYGIGAAGMGSYQGGNLQSFNADQTSSAPKGNKALALSEMSAFLNDQPQPAGVANTSGYADGSVGDGSGAADGSGDSDGGDGSDPESKKSNWDQFKDDPMGFAMNKGMDLATKGLAKIGLTPDDAMNIAGAVSSVMGAVDKVKGTYGKIKNVLGALSGGSMPLSLCAVGDAVASGDIVNKVSSVIDSAKNVYKDAKKFINDGKSLIHGLANGKGFKGKLLALASGVGQMADDVSQGADDVNKIYNIATGYDDKGSGSSSGGGDSSSDGGDNGAYGDGSSTNQSGNASSGDLASDGQGQFEELSDSSGYSPSVSEDAQNSETFGEMEY